MTAAEVREEKDSGAVGRGTAPGEIGDGGVDGWEFEVGGGVLG